MSEQKQQMIDLWHSELAGLYQSGGWERKRIEGLWARIERAEAEEVRETTGGYQ